MGCAHAESIRRRAIEEMMSVDVSPGTAQRVWLRVIGVRCSSYTFHCSFCRPGAATWPE